MQKQKITAKTKSISKILSSKTTKFQCFGALRSGCLLRAVLASCDVSGRWCRVRTVGGGRAGCDERVHHRAQSNPEREKSKDVYSGLRFKVALDDQLEFVGKSGRVIVTGCFPI